MLLTNTGFGKGIAFVEWKEMKKMVEALLILHRKEDSQRKCVCGSPMKFVNGWVCQRQYKTGEPSSMTLRV